LIGTVGLGAAWADIDVFFSPQDSVIAAPGFTTTVDIVADIPEADAVVGWGLDVSIVNTLIATLTNVAIEEVVWDAAFAPDGDDLAALAPAPDSVWGTGIVLATLTFTGQSAGVTGIALGATPGDNTEGFALDPGVGGFATANYGTGTVTVLPEPASLVLLAAAGLLLRRR